MKVEIIIFNVSHRDDVCVLSVTGTAALINPKYTFETFTSAPTKTYIATVVGSAPKDIPPPQERTDEKDIRKLVSSKEVAQSLPISDKKLSDLEHETESVSLKIAKETGCTLCHIPYRKSSTFDMHTKKCSLCK